MAATRRNLRSRHLKRTGKAYVWIIIGSVVILGFTSVIFTLLMGRVYGQELQPKTFAIREFVYWEIPLLRRQITPVWHESLLENAASEPSIFNNLGATQNIPNFPADRWDLVNFHAGTESTRYSDAEILARQLNLGENNGANYFWVEWSKSHPKRAAEMWPAVQSLAVVRMYWGIPKILDLYRSATEKMTLRPERDELMVEICVTSAEDLVASEQLELASAVIALGEKHGKSARLSELKEICSKAQKNAPR